MRRQKGFTLIELLIVVAIIGIIAAIAIPNLLNAINRGRQKRTMADIRTIATAVESYLVDMNAYPKVADSVTLAVSLAPYLEPTYIRKIPVNDGWNAPYLWGGSVASGNAYTIWSGTRDKNTTMTYVAGTTSDFNADIVFSSGSFVMWPEGVQTGQ